MASDFISDEEMMELEKSGKAKSSAPDFISDEEMERLDPKPHDRGLLNTIDSYTRAPVRKAISERLAGRSAVKGFLDQFGEPTELAPTGVQLSAQLGVPKAPTLDPGMLDWRTGVYTEGRPLTTMQESVAGISENVTDPMNVIVPVAGKGLMQASKIAGRGLIKAATAVDRLHPDVKELINLMPAGSGPFTLKAADMISKFVKQYPKVAEIVADIEKTGVTPEKIEAIDQVVKSKGKYDPFLKKHVGEVAEKAKIDPFSKIQKKSRKPLKGK